MRQIRTLLKHYGLLAPLLIAVCVIGLLAYVASSLGVNPPLPGLMSVTDESITMAPPPTRDGLSIPALNPTLVPLVDRNQSEVALAFNVSPPPIGAYLPRAGNVNFQFPPPTLTAFAQQVSAALTAPAPPLPYVTSPPLLPTIPPVVTASPTATPSPTPTWTPTITPLPDDVKPLLLTVTAFSKPTLDPVVLTAAALPTDNPPATVSFRPGECAPSGLPVAGILTQRYSDKHSGIDLATPIGTPVISTQSGQVTWAAWNPTGYGRLVIIQNGPFITYYAHLSSFNVSRGDLIGKGSVIAFSGSSGNSSGPHVHYETRLNDIPVDPLSFSVRGYPTC
jgi:murein DD-endopeptidase MepM/ murein hydrolase activator NlpD